ncbi:hypothetical protein PFLUV_G00261500 [Perca fluviatilis]|uniref:Uncharacterized protein n=1 Tax=Perca fluviatilis TaxID=8168 RepID=A0A6A5E1Q5_PERFL|nr:hypothetical protein PFLUV_G00261500 [Perca fluviatilis]
MVETRYVFLTVYASYPPRALRKTSCTCAQKPRPSMQHRLRLPLNHTPLSFVSESDGKKINPPFLPELLPLQSGCSSCRQAAVGHRRAGKERRRGPVLCSALWSSGSVYSPPLALHAAADPPIHARTYPPAASIDA